MSALPALLLVHGAWHGPWCWRQLIDELPDIDVRTVALPSSGDDTAASGVLGDLRDDAAVVAEAVAAIDGPVVVVAHSYGGVPVTEALGSVGDVRRLVYLCAFQLDVGDSLLSSVGGTPPPWWEVREREGHIVALEPERVFYGDVDPELVEQAVAQVGVQSLASFSQPLTRAAWHTLPSTYVVCEADCAIPPFAQEAMSNRAQEVRRLDASHSPFLSRPAELAALLREELAR
ncbi:Pimeloyl-ACP methyl ester carboxylesterase [Streptomyces sp. yr375]|uniref:alpha/beta hydrolase n=1 Tax=Streptomyces sp. yr375 TaxID=1761906 RepID=UPI0008B9CF63|nr:alpha/beta hydrolase [Streptomyces sp. yr375]SES49616.1 Pimeloyl-ACP methyl ester carboxylesterase [Streptomyces sp. yr375]